MPPPGIHLRFQQSTLFRSHLKAPAAIPNLYLRARAAVLIWPNFTQPCRRQFDSFVLVRAYYHESIATDTDSGNRPPSVRRLGREHRVGGRLLAFSGQTT